MCWNQLELLWGVSCWAKQLWQHTNDELASTQWGTWSKPDGLGGLVPTISSTDAAPSLTACHVSSAPIATSKAGAVIAAANDLQQLASKPSAAYAAALGWHQPVFGSDHGQRCQPLKTARNEADLLQPSDKPICARVPSSLAWEQGLVW